MPCAHAVLLVAALSHQQDSMYGVPPSNSDSRHLSAVLPPGLVHSQQAMHQLPLLTKQQHRCTGGWYVCHKLGCMFGAGSHSAACQLSWVLLLPPTAALLHQWVYGCHKLGLAACWGSMSASAAAAGAVASKVGCILVQHSWHQQLQLLQAPSVAVVSVTVAAQQPTSNPCAAFQLRPAHAEGGSGTHHHGISTCRSAVASHPTQPVCFVGH